MADFEKWDGTCFTCRLDRGVHCQVDGRDIEYGETCHCPNERLEALRAQLPSGYKIVEESA